MFKSRVNRHYIYIISLFLLSYVNPALSDELIASYSQEQVIKEVIDNCLDHNYAEAESSAAKIIRNAPDSPAGYFYYAGIINSIMLDYEENYRLDDFQYYVDKTVEKASAGMALNPEDPYNHYYSGGALSYLAYRCLYNKQYLHAFSTGMKAIGELKMTLELDSTFYDAYLGLGNYMYWLSKKTELLKWMPVIPDHRQQGIDYMYLAVKKSKCSGDAVASSLAGVLIDAGRFSEALELAQGALQRHPDSRFFLFAQARSFYELGRYREAIECYQKLLTSLRQAPVNNHFNEISVLVKLAEANFYLRQYRPALDFCQQGLNLSLSPDMRHRKKEALQSLKNLAEQCQRKLP